MLGKYWLPAAVLVTVLGVWASAEEPAAPLVHSVEEDVKEVGESGDLEAQELFLRPVVIKYGHDHPAVYTWQGGSSSGAGWGVYKQQQGGMQQGWGWPKKPPKKGWGWGEGKKKKKKKKGKKKKGKKKKGKKKKGGKKNEAWGSGGGKKGGGGGEGGWGQVEEGGKGGKKKGGGGGWEESSEEEGGWGEDKKKGKKKKGKKKKGGKKKKKGGGGWGDDDDDDDGGWRSNLNQYRFALNQGVQRFGGLEADHVEYIPVVPADALPFQGFDGYYQDAYVVPEVQR